MARPSRSVINGCPAVLVSFAGPVNTSCSKPEGAARKFSTRERQRRFAQVQHDIAAIEGDAAEAEIEYRRMGDPPITALSRRKQHRHDHPSRQF